jgi:putative hemolysin
VHSLAAILFVLSLFVYLCAAAAETALASLGSARRRQLIARPGLTARRVARLLDRPEALLGTIVLGGSLALLVATGCATILASRWLSMGWSVVVAVSVVGVAAVVGEAMVRVLATRNPDRAAGFTAWPLALLVALLTPLVRLASFIAALVVPHAGTPFAARASVVTKEEIETLITVGEQEGALERDERRLLHSIFDLSETTVKEVMTPRNDIVGLPADATYEEIMKTVVESGYSRLPVYEGTMDEIVGIAYVKDLLTMWDHRELIILHDVMREPLFVPEAKRIDDLLREFQKSHTQMSIVLDEYGGVSGLVTMEDVLEEIVGEIQDEYDEELVPIEELPDGGLRVTGRASVRKINAEYNADFPEQAYATMGGFVQSLFARIPRIGDVVESTGWHITVEEMDGRRIARMFLSRLPEKSEEEAQDLARGRG